MNKYRFGLLFFVIIFLPNLYGFGTKDNQNKTSAPKTEKTEKVQITGFLRLVGSEPFTEYVISGEKEWFINKDEEYKIKKLYYSAIYGKVTAEGYEVSEKLVFASGLPAGVKYYIKNFEIIRLE